MFALLLSWFGIRSRSYHKPTSILFRCCGGYQNPKRKEETLQQETTRVPAGTEAEASSEAQADSVHQAARRYSQQLVSWSSCRAAYCRVNGEPIAAGSHFSAESKEGLQLRRRGGGWQQRWGRGGHERLPGLGHQIHPVWGGRPERLAVRQVQERGRLVVQAENAVRRQARPSRGPQTEADPGGEAGAGRQGRSCASGER